MIERCPCCNARLMQATICPRCQADLTAVINSELSAEIWLNRAIQYLVDGQVGRSSNAINLSLQLKKTQLAWAFRDFIIQQQCKDILDLLAQAQLSPAKRKLYQVRELIPYSKQLKQLDTFANYLLAKEDRGNIVKVSIKL